MQFLKGIVNKLGNKILLEEKINRSIGNEWFRTKISTKLGNKTGYIDSVYPIASVLVEEYKDVNKPYWKKEDINAATEKAADRIVEFIFWFVRYSDYGIGSTCVANLTEVKYGRNHCV